MSDSKPNFDADFDAEAGRPVEAEIQSLLNARGQRMRDRVGIADRVTRSTLPLISSEGISSEGASSGWVTSAKPFNLIAARQRIIRWRVGFAVAASLVVAFVIVNLPTNRIGIDATSEIVSSTDQGGTVAEPVLVSLLGGSEIIDADGNNEFVIDEVSAMPILRSRDASFGDLNSEVQLILASALSQ
ncbi:MAG: hypothetical protein O3B75_04965 [Planctomycetota bacterium]|nr:hypothetical protein [Planctomycetota bacterium]